MYMSSLSGARLLDAAARKRAEEQLHGHATAVAIAAAAAAAGPNEAALAAARGASSRRPPKGQRRRSVGLQNTDDSGATATWHKAPPRAAPELPSLSLAHTVPQPHRLACWSAMRR